MPSPEKMLAQQFEDYLGYDRFMLFVQAGVASRLRYWQEMEVNKFLAANPSVDVTLLLNALNVCEIHRCKLHRGTVPLVSGEVDYGVPKEEKSIFPRANSRPRGGGKEVKAESVIEVWFCSECRLAEQAWREQRHNISVTPEAL